MTNILKNQLGPALRVLAFLFAAVLVYTGIVTVFGSHLPEEQGVITTVGQPTGEGLFQGRPASYSAVEKDGKVMLVAESTALDPDSPAYEQAVQARKDQLSAADPEHRTDIPRDLWTASASGCDPDISLEGAQWQIPRLMEETGKTQEELERIIQASSSTSLLSGITTVNVQKANLLLDTQAE